VSNNPFEKWLEAQYHLETESFSNDPPRLGEADRKDYARWNAYALEDELHEATREIGWKPWASSTHFNREAFIAEMVDVLFFTANLLLLAAPIHKGVFVLRSGDETTEHVAIRQLAWEVWEAYKKKIEVNAARMRQGYDGVTNRCPYCDRELVDNRCPQHGGLA
jgi:hypothetical protein